MRAKIDNKWFAPVSRTFGLLVVAFSFFMYSADRDMHPDIQNMRAARPDASSFSGSTPEVVSPFDSSLLAEIKKCVCQLKNLINNAVLCSPIPVTEVGSISTSGTYCLANDLVGTFTIDAPRVILDMNGKQLSGGIYLLSSASEVVIKNGFINGGGVENGIDIAADLHDIYISDMNISNASIGINGIDNTRLLISDTVVVECSFLNLSLTSCDDILIEHSLFNAALDSAPRGGIITDCTNLIICNSYFNENGPIGSFVGGLFVNGCSNVLLKENSCNNNTGSGVVALNCADVVVKESCFNGNGNNGLSVRSSSRALVADSIFNNNGRGLLGSANICWEIAGCSANSNENEGYFLITSTLVCTESVACENVEQGFRVLDAPDFCLDRCVAKVNTLDGFLVTGVSQGLVKECISISNATCGFNDDAGAATDVSYGANLAQSNGTGNYCDAGISVGLGVAPYFSVAITGAAFWDNISV